MSQSLSVAYEKWNKMYDLLYDWVITTNNLPNPGKSASKEQTLFIWCCEQRREHANKRLSRHYVAKMELIPYWDWHSLLESEELWMSVVEIITFVKDKEDETFKVSNVLQHIDRITNDCVISFEKKDPTDVVRKYIIIDLVIFGIVEHVSQSIYKYVQPDFNELYVKTFRDLTTNYDDSRDDYDSQPYDELDEYSVKGDKPENNSVFEVNSLDGNDSSGGDTNYQNESDEDNDYVNFDKFVYGKKLKPSTLPIIKTPVLTLNDNKPVIESIDDDLYGDIFSSLGAFPPVPNTPSTNVTTIIKQQSEEDTFDLTESPTDDFITYKPKKHKKSRAKVYIHELICQPV